MVGSEVLNVSPSSCVAFLGSLPQNDPNHPYVDNVHIAHAAVDTLAWQAFASVIIPGAVINRSCAFAGYALRRWVPSLPHQGRVMATTCFGLALIPAIIHPIDEAVHVILDRTWRPFAEEHKRNVRARYRREHPGEGASE